jgi:hypothetical protein
MTMWAGVKGQVFCGFASKNLTTSLKMTVIAKEERLKQSTRKNEDLI